MAGGIARAALIITLGNIFSRVLGLVRESVTAGLFGNHDQAQGYITALRVQTSIYDLLVSGVISAAFIPVFSAIRDDDAEFRRAGSTILTLTFIVMVVAMGALELFARDAIALLAGSSSPSPPVQATAIVALRLLGPALVFLGLSGVLTALLYARQRFVFPAFSPAIFNLSIVLAALLLNRVLHVNSLVVGVVAGAAAQVMLQAYGLRHSRLRPMLALGDPRVRQILRLAVPVFLGLIITQGQVLLDLRLAYSTGPGLPDLNYATRIIQLPLGIVATAMSLASLPALSRLEGADYRATLARGLTITLILIVPAVVVCTVLAGPVIALAFQHGSFDAEATRQTADALRYYAPGLVFAAVDQLLIFAFYAKNDTRTPVLVGIVSIVAYLVVALLTLHPLSFRGLALADSAKQVTHAVVLYVLLRRWQGRIEGLSPRGTLGKIVLAGAAMAALCAVLVRIAGTSWTTGTPHLLVFLFVVGGAGLTLYVLVLSRLGVPELAVLGDRLASRLPRRR